MKSKYFRHFTVFGIVLVTVLVLMPVDAYSYSTLKLDKTVFGQGEDITVYFSIGDTVAQNAWIGIIPSHVAHGSEAENDKYDLTYQYLQGRQSGSLVFKAPNQMGKFDFRLHDTDNNGKELASVTFTVGGTTGTLSLNKSVFTVGEDITVYFTAGPGFSDNAWVGIVPSNIPHGSEAENDKHDIAYQYLKSSPSGSLAFKAPNQPGTYDFRLHDTDNNGKEIASVTFQVSQ
jgi:hypothetical protein